MATWIRASGSEIELQDTDDHKSFALKQGWTLKSDKPDVPETIDTTQNKQYLANLVRELNGKTLDLRGSIDKVREKAKAMMETDDGDSSTSH